MVVQEVSRGFQMFQFQLPGSQSCKMTSTDPLALPQPTHPPSHPRPDMGDLGKMKVLWISSRLLQGHWLFCGPYGFRVIFLKKERQNGTGWEGNSYSEGDVRWGRQAHEKSR